MRSGVLLVVFLIGFLPSFAQNVKDTATYNFRGNVIASTSTSSVMITNEAITVYPNPCSGSFNVHSVVVGDIDRILITDQMGHLVYEGSGLHRVDVRIDNMDRWGVLLARIDAGGKIFSKTIIVQNSTWHDLP